MLFSNPEIADYINTHFEPTWKSLRPVPKVTVDFGNGTVVKRTLNGNIATFVCTADGTIVDVIAGITEPNRYLQILQDLQNPDTARAKRQASPSPYNQLLGGDTDFNEGIRRRIIHDKLATMPNAKPDDIIPWLYKDVLHADLADPMLGLGKVLYSTYPFSETMPN